MKTESPWIRVTNCDNIPLREGRAVSIDGHDIAIFNLGDRFLAIDNRCPHNGGPLADGIVSGMTVVCPLHAWKVNLECGAVTKPAGTAACLRTFRTRVEDGVVLLDASAVRAFPAEDSVENEIDCHSVAAKALLELVPESANRI
jgi:nitrite reductase (NADH) small subunit